ncbi:MAG: AMP-binding protein [Alphaproteobacteria bacterium]|nr:AMP-binding protein [Alphaproteobacteria bacterium]
MNVALLLEMAAQGMGDRTALRWPGGALTFEELYDRARRAAGWLAGQPGDKLVYLGPNRPAFPVALYGAAMAGRPFVPVNYRLKDEDLRRIVARTAPALLVADDAELERVAGIEGLTALSISEFMAAARGAEPIRETVEQEDGIAVLLFTSGTTGEPKAAILRHHNLSGYVISTVEFMASEDGEAAIVSVPPYHIAGISAVLTATYAGRTTIQLPHFDPEAWVSLAREAGATHAMVVPTMLKRILETLEARGETLPGLRHLSYGGGRMPTAVIEKAMALLPHVDFVNAYGLTETSSTIAVLGPDDHREAFASADPSVRARLGSVGRPLPVLELDIRDEAGAPLPAGEKGEIWVRGEQVSGEYVGRKAVRDDGWFPTNDAGWMDEAGYLFVEGRLDDVIVRGGENIAPGEIEDVLRLHPAVTDAAVFGAPDEEWGEKIVAVLVADGASEDELQGWVRDRLRSTKVPQTIQFRGELPYNDTGKLLRRTLKQEFVAGSRP